MMISRSKAGYSNEEWLARRITASTAALLLTGIALATQLGDGARKPDPSSASRAAARVAPDAHVLELLREHRRAVYDGRVPYSLLQFAQ